MSRKNCIPIVVCVGLWILMDVITTSGDGGSEPEPMPCEPEYQLNMETERGNHVITLVYSRKLFISYNLTLLSYNIAN